jgi:hypothetical protein
MEEKVESPELKENQPRFSEGTRVEDDKGKELEKAQSGLSRVAIFPKSLERRVRRKLDWNIVPLILALYTLSVLDRSNIGNAKVAGMSTDLDLTGNKYQWLLNIFYIPCIPFKRQLMRYFV